MQMLVLACMPQRPQGSIETNLTRCMVWRAHVPSRQRTTPPAFHAFAAWGQCDDGSVLQCTWGLGLPL